MRENPRPQELYRHFKGNLYQILTLARHSETGETLVVYQALQGGYGVWARPLEMFLSEVDWEKYPEAAQKYRFERVEKEKPEPEKEGGASLKESIVNGESGVSLKESIVNGDSGASSKESNVNGNSVTNGIASAANTAEDGGVSIDPLVEAFLDARTTEEKLRLIESLRPRATDEMVDTMAIASGVEIDAGSVQERLNDLRECLRTIEKYEQTRGRFRA